MQQQGVSPSEGLSVTSAALAQHPDIAVVLTAVGDAAQGAYQALVTAGRPETDAKTYVGGLDANLFALQKMKAGTFFRATVTVDGIAIAHAPSSTSRWPWDRGRRTRAWTCRSPSSPWTTRPPWTPRSRSSAADVGLVLQGLTKRYGATLALDGVDLTIASGTVHGLLGHNGAGKSTLIKCLGGATAPTAGTMELDGEPLVDLTPRRAIASGVAVIYQHLSLVGNMSVADNLFLGQEVRSGGVPRARPPPARPPRRRSPSSGPRSPRAPWCGTCRSGSGNSSRWRRHCSATPSSSSWTSPPPPWPGTRRPASWNSSNGLRDRGLAILYVTHLLAEVTRLADRVSTLRDGRQVFEADLAGLTTADLAASISGRSASRPPAPPAPPADPPVVLRTRGLQGRGMGPVDLTLRGGEVVALFGLVGSGRTRILETLYRGGTQETEVDGRRIDVGSPAKSLRAGSASSPGTAGPRGCSGGSRRWTTACSASCTASVAGPGVPGAANAASSGRSPGTSPCDPWPPTCRWTASPAATSRRSSSAGRCRRATVARPAARRTHAGVDVGARAEIYDVVHGLAARGAAVLFATNEADEVLTLAHRCLVVRDGRSWRNSTSATCRPATSSSGSTTPPPTRRGTPHEHHHDPSGAPVQEVSPGARLRAGLTRNPLLVLLVVMVAALQVSTGTALDWGNLRGVLLDAAVIAVVAVPGAVLVICGYIDLSVGSTLALGGVVAGKVMAGGQGNPVLAVVLAVAVGAFVGLVNGVLSTFFGLSSFIVTLGSLTAVRGAAQTRQSPAVNTFGDTFGFLASAPSRGSRSRCGWRSPRSSSRAWC